MRDKVGAHGGTAMSEQGRAGAVSPAGADEAAAAEAFADRFVNALNEVGMLLMVSIGHRTGLFEALLDGAAVTSEELAMRTGLEERYVREWLRALAVARVLDLEDGGRYRLPPSRGELLTGAEDNLAVFGQYVAVLGAVEDDVVRCFREGGGVPYDRYGRFQEVMAEDSAQTVLAALHDHIIPLVAGLSERLEAGIRVLDLGCGRGRALLSLAARYPRSRFTGVDLSAEAISWARSRARTEGLENVTFEVRDLRDFDTTAEPAAYDLVTTFDAVHDQPRPGAMLRGIRRTLAPDGVYLMQDIHASTHVHGNMDHPVGTFLYAVSTMHCMTVSLAQGGDGLGTMWGREQAWSLLEEAGFRAIKVHQLDHDFQNDYWVVRP